MHLGVRWYVHNNLTDGINRIGTARCSRYQDTRTTLFMYQAFQWLPESIFLDRSDHQCYDERLWPCDEHAGQSFPDTVSTATVIDGDFVVDGDSIRVTGQILESGQTVSDIATCATKISAQFTQDTKGVCKLKDFNRGKCKSGDILPDGTVMP